MAECILVGSGSQGKIPERTVLYFNNWEMPVSDTINLSHEIKDFDYIEVTVVRHVGNDYQPLQYWFDTATISTLINHDTILNNMVIPFHGNDYVGYNLLSQTQWQRTSGSNIYLARVVGIKY